MASVVPALSPRLQDTLAAFAAGGVSLSPDEIVWLATLRRPCDHPADGSIPWVMGAPVDYAGVKWYPLHRLAESWWVRANDLLADDQHMQVALYLYAHAFSGTGDKRLLNTMTRAGIRKAVSEWFANLPIQDAQIVPLCDRLRELDGEDDCVPAIDPKPSTGERATDDLPAFVSIMCKAFPGVSPEYWLTECSASEARGMLDKVSSDDNFATSMQRSNAIRNYLTAVKWLWRIHRG